MFSIDVPRALVKFQAFTWSFCGVKFKAELLPLVAIVVEPLFVVENVISLEESYCSLNCGVETDVMV